MTTLYTGGVIHTLDPRAPRADAMLVRGERIVAIGTDTEMLALAGPGTQRRDLGGRAVVPGLTDSHIHTAYWSRSLVSVDLRHSPSCDAALEAIARHAATLPADAWVQGGHWDRNRWVEPVLPDRAALDPVTGGRPAWLSSMDGHSAWVNTEALRILGIDRETVNPVGGVIDRDADGEPTGILREAATLAIGDRLNDPATLPGLMRAGMQRLLSHGITSIHDVDLDGADAAGVFRALHGAGELPLRVTKMIRMAELDAAIDAGVATGDGDGYLRVGPVKVFTDGAIGSHSCLMGHDFPGEPGNHGMAVTDPATVRGVIRKAHRAGIAVAAHAIGDEANRLLLDSYAVVFAEDAGAGSGYAPGQGRLRHRVEHAQYLRRADLPRFAELGLIASMQPVHAPSDIATNEALLPDTDLACYAWRSLWDTGAKLALGSDAPVEDPNPWWGIHAAVTRERPDGTPPGGWQPEERLSLAEALAGYCVIPAYATCEDHLKGRLVPGMFADFAVLTADPFAIDGRDLQSVAAELTVVGGRIRFDSGA